ncbi:MAG: hypothetical protein CMF61_03715 [Magnetococcales bacterium]|nr:hypothetical protein [Magnetococcales bacterium]
MKKYLVIILAVTLSACSSAARFDNMAVQKIDYINVSQESDFYKNIMLSQVNGGKDNNPMLSSRVDNKGLQQAVELSLLNNHYLCDDPSKAKYSLDVSLLELDKPLMGISLDVTSKINYKLTEILTSNELHSKDYSATYTAKFSDSPIAIKRLRLANEGSINENIKLFLMDLKTLSDK